MIKIQWVASIWRQNDQNVELRRKTFKRKLNYKSDKNPMTCIDLTSKLSKCWGTSQNIQNNAKLQNWSNYNELHRFDVKTIKKRKTTKSNQITINLRRFDVKMIKMLSYVAKHSKQSKTTKVIKIQWLASIWRQNDQNVELRRKTFKTKLNYKSDQNPTTCIDWMSKRSKQRYTTKVIKIQWLASIWRQNDQNVELRRETFKTKLNYKSDQNPILASIWRQNDQNIQNKAKLQKWSKSNDLHRFDVKTIKMLSYVAKHSKES